MAKFNIAKKPTKLALARALFDREPFVLTVKTEPKGEGTIKVIINNVTAEDGSAESWTLKGFHEMSNARFEAWLRTDKDEGWIRFKEPTQ